MPEEVVNDVNTDQPVTDPSVTQAPAQPEGVTVDPATPPTEEAVSYDRFKEINEQKIALEAQLQAVQQQMLVNNAQPVQQPQQNEQNQYETFLRQRGIDPDGILTAAEQAQLMGEFVQVNNANLQRQAFMTQTQDYANVVGQKNALGQYVKPDGTLSAFQIALNKDPYLAQAGLNEQSAYAIGKREMEIAQIQIQNNTTTTTNNQMLAAAATAPMPGVAVGGGGAIPSDAGIEQMDLTSPEGQAYYARVKAGEFD